MITNIDPEHLDHYGDLAHVKEAFVAFANRVPFYGLVVACLDHPNVQDILPSIDKRVATYGLAAQADYRARNPRMSGLSVSFDVVRRGEELGTFEVRMPGIHNVLNALAVIAVADELRVPHDELRKALATFGGVQRRFTIVAEHALPQSKPSDEPVVIVDDYAHHPAEIVATLEAAQRAYGRRLVVAFQPHRYTRTRDCFEDFVKVLSSVDGLLLAEVYAAGEAPIVAADGRSLARAIRVAGSVEPVFVEDIADMPKMILSTARDGDVVITMGAGSIGAVPGKLASIEDVT